MGGILGIATITYAFPGQAQTVTKTDAAKPPQGETQAAPDTPKKKFPSGGVWHHFGEKDNASVAGRGQPVERYSSGASRGTSKVSPDATARNFTARRIADSEKQMWVLINQDRLKPEALAETGGQAHPLRWNENLAAVARAHSRNMLAQRSFSHVDSDGTTFSARINRAGIAWEASGENIAIYDTVLGAESAFMNEPRFQRNHRANILNASYTDVGIGIVQAPDGSLYITQDFVATPLHGDAAKSAP